MKKTTWVLALMLLVSSIFAGCGSADTQAASDVKTAPSAQTESQDGETADAEETADAGEMATADAAGSKTLVIYFSRTGEQYNVGVINKGNTAIVAEMIAEQTGADLFEIVPAEDTYPDTYDALTEVAKQEQSDGTRPAYQEAGMPDLSQYDTVYIGAPVWWGDWPMIMYTFFEANADSLAGKTLYPFSTHEGSGLAGFDQKLAGALPGSTVGDGLAVRGQDAQNEQEAVREDVASWIASH